MQDLLRVKDVRIGMASPDQLRLREFPADVVTLGLVASADKIMEVLT